jgi:hypothetical protein
VFLFSVVFPKIFYDFGSGARLLSLVMYYSSVIISYIFFMAAFKLRASYLYNFIFFTVCLVVFFSLLEFLFSPFYKVMSDVRGLIYGGVSYSGFERDLAVYGGVRPQFLFSEPSHLAFFISSSVYLLVLGAGFEKAGKVTALAFLILIISFFSIRSPVVIIGMILVFYINVVRMVYSGGSFLSVGGIILSVIFSIYVAFMTVGDRVVGIMDGEDFSAAARLVVPSLVGIDSLNDYSFFGVGLGRADIIYGYVVDSFYSLGFRTRLIDFSADEVEVLVTNYFWLHWIYNGILGGIGIYVLIVWLFGVGSISGLLCVFVPFLLMGWGIGAYLGLKIWMFFALMSFFYFQGSFSKRWEFK